MACTSCQTPIPPEGKFCPKCGRPAHAASPPVPAPRARAAVVAHPSGAPLPKAGKVIFSLLLLGLALAVGGYMTGHNCVGIAGTVLVAILVLLMCVGDAFF